MPEPRHTHSMSRFSQLTALLLTALLCVAAAADVTYVQEASVQVLDSETANRAMLSPNDLANYWYIALSGFAVMMSLMLHNVLYRTRGLARGVFAELSVDAASFGATEHDLLVRKGSVVTRHDVAESVIVFGCGIYIAYEMTFTYHIFEFGGRNDLPAKPWYSLTAWWVTIFVAIMGITMLL